MQSSAATTEGLSSPLFGAYTFPAFKFQLRHDSVDWRRISALDVERVVRELDVATLQENIAGVTFCNLDGETCSRCGQPVDPVLLKVLRLAQLTIEYLLHCQDCLSASVAQLEAQLQASMGQQERGQQELGRQADELKSMREESRRCRKMISTLQQLLLQTGTHGYHTCHLCDKMFMNATFLRGHIQRRHAGMAEGDPTGKQKKQEQPVEKVLEELQAKLKWTQEELETQREAERQRRLQEAEIIRQKEIEAKKEFDEWKEKEMKNLYREIDKLKKLFWDEFKSVANQNSVLEEKLQVLQSHSVAESNLEFLRDEEPKERLRLAQELQALREKMGIQKMEWKRKMKELQEKHVAQKRELQEENEKLQASLSWEQRKAAAQSQHHTGTLCSQLQDQARLIASQEMIQTMSVRKVEGTLQGPKAADTEEDSSEEELLNSQDGQQKVLAALRLNPTLLMQFRPLLEENLEEKLESMGIRRGAKGISVQTLRHMETILKAQREQKAGRFSEFLSLREKLVKETTSRVKERQKNGATVAQTDGEPPVKSQQSSLVTKEAYPKAGTLHVKSPSKPAELPTLTLQSCGPGLTQMPIPTPCPRVYGSASSPASLGPRLSTPPFSSEDDSEGDTVQCVSLQRPQVPSRMGSRLEDDWDWSDTETSEGNAQLSGKGSGGLASSGTLVQSMVKNLEKKLKVPVKKPSGGVSLFLLPNAGPQRAAMPGQKPQVSEDESDLEISSLEDLSQDLDQEKPKTLSCSQLPEKFGSSPWSSSRSRVPGW
ncbi:cilium assembly protein DZIP1L isoform X2 [Elephas maximus indicus]|nr:cilium assembly protein DZIP1L isoform X2 [Elephas maximus indicus]XP_049726232.1 cilium assembly protein DZIP1L isoform X2 [Elephas maximus indicus]XP_049726233.1 cilium assembly protein DZIP1L isoform X2 [Elephas maximus indicus]XP_049726234.1 cilium assembly protein DZIP1L isoform X2 [Elephas maximus indicus]XP_049726235.1 cilium assembly protein DZIP1L isoform X2 [Elephas maximus indicus]XP_049726237.1 cilium assembly protein DZIP1L isoform X2 [Elephas maximus indicus]XP_049726238.1 ci